MIFLTNHGETSCFTLKPASAKGFWNKMKHET